MTNIDATVAELHARGSSPTTTPAARCSSAQDAVR